jgi:hypothetical protein
VFTAMIMTNIKLREVELHGGFLAVSSPHPQQRANWSSPDEASPHALSFTGIDSSMHLQSLFCRMEKLHLEMKVRPSPSSRRRPRWAVKVGGLATTKEFHRRLHNAEGLRTEAIKQGTR